MADKNYFITGLTAQKLLKLRKNEITFCDLDCDLDTGAEKGIAVDKENMGPLLQVLGVKIISEKKTDMEGIVKVELGKGEKTTEIEATEPKKEYKVSIDKRQGGWWDGGGEKQFLDILKEVLSPAVKKDILICVPHGHATEPERDDKFHVFCWSSPPGEKVHQTPETMWGYLVSCRDKSFIFSGLGIPITTDEGDVVAELIDDNLYIFHDIVHRGDQEEYAIFRRICQEVSLDLTPDPAERQKRKEELSRKAYIELCEKRLEKTITGTRESIEKGEKEIQKLQVQLVNSIREVNGCRAKLEQISSRETLETERFGREFDSLIKIPGIEKVEVNKDIVFLYTEYIYLPFEAEGIKNILDIGKFRIEIDLHPEQQRQLVQRVHKPVRYVQLAVQLAWRHLELR